MGEEVGMRRSSVTMAAVGAAFLFLMMGTSARSQEGAPGIDRETRLQKALGDGSATPDDRPRLDGFTVVGHIDPGGIRDYGDVYAHRDVAYLGTRCGRRNHGGFGVKVIDISDPANPVLASTLATPRFSRAEDVVVMTVDTPTFSGDLAVVGIQSCFGTGFDNRVRTGLMFFDVTDPYSTSLLGRWVIPGFGIGCHEVDAAQRPDGLVLAGCARNLVDHIYGMTGVDLVDATDPTAPELVGNFSLNVDVFDGVGCARITFAHSTRFVADGTAMYVSYWDAGTVLVDTGDPSDPVRVSTTQIVPPDEDGDNHSAATARGGDWLVINPEDFSPFECGDDFDGWGEAYVYDASDPTNTTLVGSFSTPNSDSSRTRGAVYTVHNTEVWSEGPDATEFMSSWYTDGIVRWEMDVTGTARSLGQFVPAGDGAIPAVWGVWPLPDQGLVLASDLSSGLWIVSPTPD
jgi:hypothetical protein